jgi:hypothetical protein
MAECLRSPRPSHHLFSQFSGSPRSSTLTKTLQAKDRDVLSVVEIVSLCQDSACKCVQFFFAWRYADSAKREATTVGTIYHVIGGRGSTYEYVFVLDGVRLYDDSGTCQTALSPQGCKVGAPVLVYYVHNPTLETRLQEFGAASRGKLFSGVWMIFFAVTLYAFYFILKRNQNDPDAPDESYQPPETDDGPEDLHVTPGR